MASNRTSVLLYSTLFPHVGEPTLGIFVENRLRNLLADENIAAFVVAPVPWFPFRHRFFGAYGRAACAPPEEQRRGITVYHPRYLVIPKIGMILTPFFLFLSSWFCIRRLKAKGLTFDLIDAHYLYPDAVAAGWLARSFGVPFCATARGSDVTQIGKMAIAARLIKAMCSAAAHIITVSENLRRDLVQMGVAQEKITTLRNGVDLTHFKPTDREKVRQEWNVAGPVMLFAGWLIPRKRLDIVLAAAAEIPSVKTVIVGDGPLRTALEATAPANVVFIGQKKPAEMPTLYSAADVLILPSDREGWANVLLEAMACGTPVVTRNVGCAEDLITDTKVGAIADTEDPSKIAAAVQTVLRNCTDRAYVRRFAEGYDWKETSKGQKAIFDAAIATHIQLNDGQ